MGKFKVISGSWHGQVGEYVRDEFIPNVTRFEEDAEKVKHEIPVSEGRHIVVLRMAGSRLVEFDHSQIEATSEFVNGAEVPFADGPASFSAAELAARKAGGYDNRPAPFAAPSPAPLTDANGATITSAD